MKEKPQNDPEKPVDAQLARLLGDAFRVQGRMVVIFLALALLTFIWFAKDAGHPVWLVTLIGFFGAILIGLAIFLIWFWLRFLKHFQGRD